MVLLNNPFLEQGNLPKETDTVVEISKEQWEDLEKVSDILFHIGKNYWRIYKQRGDDQAKIAEKIEYGLPPEIIDLLRSIERDVDKTSLRFDYFITKDGPKLIEIARNPWALLINQNHTKKMVHKGVVQFPGDEIYQKLLNPLNKKVNSVGVWKDFDMYEEVEELIQLAKSRNLHAVRLDTDEIQKLNSIDALFIDYDTAYFNSELPDLIKYNSISLPSPANIIYKHKTFVELAYSIVSSTAMFDAGLTANQKEFLGRYLVPTYHITEEKGANINENIADGGVIKDIIGMWSRQVTILSPELANSSGKRARNGRNYFRKHLGEAVSKKNAIYQEYIEPMDIANHNGCFAEISVLSTGQGYFPFVRIRSVSNNPRGVAAGLGSLKIV